MQSTVFVGSFEPTPGPDSPPAAGLYRRRPGQDSWEALNGLPEGTRVLSMVGRPGAPNTLFVGAQKGLFRSDDGGDSWTDLGVPIKNSGVFSILLHPTDPDTLYVGADHTKIYKTVDGGKTWRDLPTVQPAAALTGCFPVRVLRMALDPNAPDEVYAALEVGGFIRSVDGGETWEDCGQELLDMSNQEHLKSAILSDSETEGMLDLHALIVSPTEPGKVWIANRMGLFVSDNKGANWKEFGIRRFSDYSYGRDIITSPHDPGVFLAALSTSARGDAGSFSLTQDKGATWRQIDHDISIESTVMKVAISERDPNRIYGVARLGQVFGTEDGGKTWTTWTMPPGVSDLRAVHCI